VAVSLAAASQASAADLAAWRPGSDV